MANVSTIDFKVTELQVILSALRHYKNTKKDIGHVDGQEVSEICTNLIKELEKHRGIK